MLVGDRWVINPMRVKKCRLYQQSKDSGERYFQGGKRLKVIEKSHLDTKMSKNRLSKLQKWILTECLNCKGTYMPRAYIANNYFECRYNMIGPVGPTSRAEVSTTRSIKNLIDKGYIEAFTISDWNGTIISLQEATKLKKEDTAFTGYIYVSINLIKLTDKGTKKANQLLKVNRDNIHPINIKQEKKRGKKR